MTSDYRNSHLTKGNTYNDSLANSPWTSYMTRMETHIVTSILSSIGEIPRSLDFACGTGRLTKTIEKFADNNIALDVSQSMVSQAKKECKKTKFIIGDITKEKIDIDPVNLITSFRFFGNAQDELRIAVLEALNRLLVDDGYLLINNHRNPWAFSSISLRLAGKNEGMDLSYFKLKSLLRQCGFTVKKTYGIGWWVARSKFKTEAVLQSRTGRFLEPLSNFPPVIPICPDMVIVAQKLKT
ncbi:MAG: class I SAM-dependent methyltransferase [Methylococcaceae bacterium]